MFAESVLPAQIRGLLSLGGSGVAPLSPGATASTAAGAEAAPGQCQGIAGSSLGHHRDITGASPGQSQGSLSITYCCSRRSPVPFLSPERKNFTWVTSPPPSSEFSLGSV